MHGSSVIGLSIKESVLINHIYHCIYVNLSTSISLQEIGRNAIIKVFRYLNILKEFTKNFIYNKPDLCYIAVNSRGIGFYKDILFVLIAKFFNVPILFHFHNKGVSINQNKVIDNFLYKIAFKNSKAILLSKFLYDDVKKYFSTSNIFYCPNGIKNLSLDESYNFFTKIIKSDSEVVRLLFLSNLMESKGVFVLLKALKILIDKGISFLCTFVGAEADISIEQFYKISKELGVENNVNYVGKKFGDEKFEYYKNSDVFIFPTLNESFGLVNLEAMAFSLPIISTFEGGIPDVVKDGVTGFLINPGDINQLAFQIEKLIKDPKLRLEMGKAGNDRYIEKFTLERFEKRFVQILNNVI